MTDIKALRKENSELLQRINSLNKDFESFKSMMADQNETPKETERSLQYLSDEYEDMQRSTANSTGELKRISLILEDISRKAYKIEEEVEAIQQYSYQYNLKITGIPLSQKQESAINTSETCIKLFHKIGATNVSLQDIDIAHRVPKRRQDTSQPPAIICKFTRRLAKELVLQNRRQAKTVKACDLGLNSQIAIDKIMIFEHLTPKMQDLLYKCKTFQREFNYKYCWVKN